MRRPLSPTPGPLSVDHAVTVGAEEGQVLEFCLFARLQCQNRLWVMALDKATAPFSVVRGKVETTSLAMQGGGEDQGPPSAALSGDFANRWAAREACTIMGPK